MPTLDSYQKAGVHFLSDRRRAILADKVGLGKTIQAATAAKRLTDLQHGNVLVVCPKSVIGEWRKTIQEWGLPVSLFNVVNYEQAGAQPQPQTLIVDEAIAIKNISAQRTQEIVRIALEAQNVFFLTATPVRNHEADLFVPLYCIYPWLRQNAPTLHLSLIRSRERFLERYFRVTYRPIHTSRGTVWNEKIAGLKPETLSEFASLVSRVMLGRDMETLSPEDQPPDPVQKIVALPWPEWQREIYEEVIDGTVKLSDDRDLRVSNLFSMLMRLRQVAVDPFLIGTEFIRPSAKSAWLLDNLNDEVPTLIFSEFAEYLRTLQFVFGGRAVILTGKESTKKRAQAIDRFNAGDANIFLVSMEAGGSGLNLQTARRQVIVDYPWTPDTMEQVLGRAVRRGQKHVVEQVFLRMVGPQSIDEKMLTVLSRKGKALSRVRAMRTVWQELRKENGK